MVALRNTLLLLLVPLTAGAEAFLDPHEELDQLPASPSVSGGAVSALANPAAWATSGELETAFWWNDRALGKGGLGNYGLSIGRSLGFAFQHRVLPASVVSGEATGDVRFTDYQLGLAFGDRGSHVGLAWRWSGGDEERVGRRDGFALGIIRRPGPHLSYGLAGTMSPTSGAAIGTADVGVRPLGTPLFTLFGDYTLRDDETLDAGRWGAGLEVRPVAGLHLGFKVRETPEIEDDVRFSINLGVTLDDRGLDLISSRDEDGDRGATSYLVRVNPPHRGLRAKRALRQLAGDGRYVPISLENKSLTYQRDRWFDASRVAWVDLLRVLDVVEADPGVRGVVLNLAGLRTRAAIAWELRNRLARLRASGLEVIVHVDHARFVGYYLASVADVVSMDPDGRLVLAGLASRRTYMAGTLEKLGIGFEEWRFFTYKSLLESYARSEMSEADREQRRRIVDVIYEEVRRGVAEGRDLDERGFDRIVDEVTLLTAETAEAEGLVDRVGRWHDLGEWISEERGVPMRALPRDAWPRPTPDERWGRPPEIALVYAVGDCAMDSGIRGRATSAHLRSLARRDHTAAVVLRADSPGGQAQPSDLVAEGIRKITERDKPVVVSQGSMAASGGYWLGATGSRILTTPFTLTGSIGVAGGWAWDDGLGRKLGMRVDGVQRGVHADLFTGLRFPLLSAHLPERPLDESERAGIREHYMRLYQRFVTHVAVGRDMEEARVRELGEGRVWMGGDAVARGLCDDVGTLADALREAREMAGLAPDDEVVITEFPERRLFTLPSPRSFLPSFASLARHAGGWLGLMREPVEVPPSLVDALDPFTRAVIESPGEPLVMMPTSTLPEIAVGE